MSTQDDRLYAWVESWGTETENKIARGELTSAETRELEAERDTKIKRMSDCLHLSERLAALPPGGRAHVENVIEYCERNPEIFPGDAEIERNRRAIRGTGE